ncbi:PTS mannose transporter subunit IIA [Neobacillus drentensis]|uniref:PTS sugar transporter subunit IIA n=1 Tax=Neobacillus drentensis TaxID=220684 RepID=UPI001F31F69C|nr:PTS mannose transporter subunit IIA [Neobacillus drentensis]ULT56673.1 PTS mannose transporter subunit IIA [Neobacillus drentensis]
MKHFLIATHGELSKAFIETLELIAGKTSNVSYFGMTKLKSGDLAKEELKKILTAKKEDEHFIVLTDVFGGSVTNICTELLMEHKDFDIITGLNLPMMLTMILSGDELSIKDMINEGVRSAKEGIIHINKLVETQEGREEDDLIITD